jgi:hypothetical protein
VGVGFLSFAYKLNADQSYVEDVPDVIIPKFNGIVHIL